MINHELDHELTLVRKEVHYKIALKRGLNIQKDDLNYLLLNQKDEAVQLDLAKLSKRNNFFEQLKRIVSFRSI